MIRHLNLLSVIAAIGCGLGTATPLSAQTYPVRPVKIVVSGIPGSPFDLVARVLADKLSVKQKQSYVIENRPGAGGNTGVETVARSKPDGYTLLAALGTTFTVNPSLYRKLPFDPDRDIKFISIVGKTTTMLVVHPSMPVNSVAEFVDYARKEPISYGHGGNGTPGHLSMEYFRLLAGFRTLPVPYRGNAQLVNDLVSGQIKFGFVGAGGVAQHVREGRLRGLAVSTRTRSPLAPDLPSIAEAGFPEFEFESYNVLAAPAGIAEPIATLIELDVREALASHDLQEKFRLQDLQVEWASSTDTKIRVRADSDLWARVIKAAGLHVE